MTGGSQISGRFRGSTAVLGSHVPGLAGLAGLLRWGLLESVRGDPGLVVAQVFIGTHQTHLGTWE